MPPEVLLSIPFLALWTSLTHPLFRRSTETIGINYAIDFLDAVTKELKQVTTWSECPGCPNVLADPPEPLFFPQVWTFDGRDKWVLTGSKASEKPEFRSVDIEYNNMDFDSILNDMADAILDYVPYISKHVSSLS